MTFEQRLEGGGWEQNGDQMTGAEGKESGQNEISEKQEDGDHAGQWITRISFI